MPYSAERRLQLEISNLKNAARFQQQQIKRKKKEYAERAELAEQAQQAAEQAKHEAEQAQLKAEQRAEVAEREAQHSSAACRLSCLHGCCHAVRVMIGDTACMEDMVLH